MVKDGLWYNITQQQGIPYFVTQQDLNAEKLYRYSTDDVETVIDRLPMAPIIE
jgi:hypothetical protein